MVVSNSLKALVQTNEAVYISERIILSPLIVDMRILLASAAAAELFGFDSPADMEGQYISLLHHEDDLIHSRKWSYLRHLGETTPDEYTMRIRRRDGQVIPVLKRVLEATISTHTVWISHNLPINGGFSPIESPEVPISPELMKGWWGHASLREAELALEGRFRLHIDPQGDIIHPMDNMATPEPKSIMKLFVPGPLRYYQYFCFACLRGWISRGEPDDDNVEHQKPSRCNYPDCRSTIWDNPKTAAAIRARRK